MFKRGDVQDIYNLTPMQAGMLFHHRMNAKSSAYFEQITLSVRGTVNLEVYEKTVNKIIDKYDILRTLFLYENVKRPVQVVLKHRKASVEYSDITKLPENQKSGFVEDFKQEDRKNHFDLQRDILVRVSIIQTHNDRYEIIWSYHHILMDGWCMGIIFEDFSRIYQALLQGESITVEPGVPYSRYIKWLAKQDKQEGLASWKNYLEGYETRAELPGIPGIKVETGAMGEVYQTEIRNFSLNENQDAGFKQLVETHEVTAGTLFHTIWGVLLQRYNNTDDVVFGAVVSGRPPEIKGIQHIVGLFINTLPIRVKSHNEIDRFYDVLVENHWNAGRLKQYEYLPLPDIQSNTMLNRELIHHILAYENYPVEMQIREKGTAAPLDFAIEDISVYEQTNYDLNVIAVPTTPLKVRFNFNRRVYSPRLIEKIAAHFKEILNQVIANPNIRVRDIEILSPREKEQLLYEVNRNRNVNYPHEKTIYQVFAEKVEKTPDHIALVGKEEKFQITNSKPSISVTYSELNARANRLAYFLQEKGVTTDTIVALMVEPSMEMIIGILGILKAGGAYLPIDPDYPEERINYMLNDSGTEILLTSSELSNCQLSSVNYQLSMNSQPAASLAYIIYTSGTTGTPKGSMIEHRNVVRLLVNDQFPFDFNEQDVWTMFHSFCFDFSVWEMYGALLFGGKLVVIPRAVTQDTRQFLEILKKQNVTVLNQTPSAFYNLIAHELESQQNDLTLRYVIFGGEALIPLRLKEWFKKYPHTRLVNMYGITETTVHVTFKEITEEDINGNISNIGKPIPTLSVYVVDRYFRLMPFNAVGECCVEGDGVCRGYLNQPELTAERFLFISYKSYRTYRTYISKKIYKTGDLMRMLDDGDMEYVGRMDHQVKIRGFRVEPGEVETVLLQHPSVREAVVVAREDNQGDTYLCAYFVTGEAIKKIPGSSELKKYLLDKLPDYMVPASLVPMEKFPLTPSGKLDRKALPDRFYLESAGSKYTVAAPTDKIEEKLVEIWSEILNLDKSMVGIDDNFFERGGHSLKATRMASLLHKTFNINIPLPEIFSHPFIREMARYIRETEVKKAYASIPQGEKKDYYSLSSAQKRLYFLMQIDETNIAYNIPFAVVLKGEPDIVKLENTFRRLIERHESLRTSFHMFDNEPVQKIHDDESFEIERHADIIRDFLRPFDLSRPPLLRVGLIKAGHQEYTLLLDIHHIVSDGTSMGILVKEFMAIYGNEELALLRIQYKDYSAWQTNRKQEEIIKRQEAFWLRQMEGEIPVLNLPCDFPRPAAQSFAGRRIDFEIGSSRTKTLKELTKKEDFTVFMVLLALFNILLAKLGNQEDIIVGTPAEGRRHEDLQDIVGMFVNTLALRNFPRGEKTALQFMKEVKKNTLGALDNQEYQFEDLVEAAGFQRDNTGRNPIFDVMLVFQTQVHDIPNLQKPGLKAQTYEFDNPTAKFDMTLTAAEEGIFTLEYSVKLFKEETIQRFIRYFENILSSVLENPARQIADIDYIPEEEKQQLLVEFNDTNAGYPVEKTIDQLVEEQAVRTPDGVAVVGSWQLAVGKNKRAGKTVQFTYKKLNQKSDQLAHLLRERGAEPGDIVALITEPSVELVIGILGILKAGGVFLPIDPDYPEERIQYMLHDSNTRVLLSEVSEVSKLSGEIEVVKLSELSKEPTHLTHLTHPTHLCYIIYTSGSTGRPKGVAVQHQSLVNLCWWQRTAFSINPADRVGKFYRTGFDASIWEIFPYLIAGASVYIVEKEVKLDIHALKRCYETHGITIGSMPPQLYEQFITLTIDNPALRSVQMGGDRLKAYAPDHYSVVNIYGPTENTIVTTSFIVDKNYDNIPIGKPIANVQVYILDRYLRLQPIGVVGELCISGDGLAAGYLNQPELTAEKFDQDLWNYQDYQDEKKNKKFLRGPGAVFIKRAPGRRRQKIYRTGDLARWLGDGNIEFWGRMDEQVKIRGFRIEPGEIEKQLLAHDGIKEAVVTAREENGGDKYLCAYIVTDSVETVTDAVLRDYLSKTLPQYMIPMYFVTLDRFPLTPNDKVDRKALPDPGLNRGLIYTAPRDEIERIMAGIWSGVLGREVGIHDDFFKCGGHSIKAISLINSMHKAFNKKISVQNLFQYPTIAELSRLLAEKEAAEFIHIEPQPFKSYYELSYNQKRIWILHQLNPGSSVFNMPVRVTLEPSAPGDSEAIKKVLAVLAARHESFRTGFREEGEAVVQVIQPGMEAGLPIEEIDLTNLPVEEAEARRQELFLEESALPFNIDTAPLWRVKLVIFKYGFDLILNMHHLISDGWSMDILRQEFGLLYHAFKAGEDNPSKPLRIQYKDYAAWQNQLLSDKDRMKEAVEFWKQQLSDDLPVLKLPYNYYVPEDTLLVDHDDPSSPIDYEIKQKLLRGSRGRFSRKEPPGRRRQKSAGYRVVVPGSVVEGLRSIAFTHHASLFMVLLAGFNMFLSILRGQEDIVLAIPGAGRQHEDLKNIVGLFVNTLIIRTRMNPGETFSKFLNRVRENTLKVLEYQSYPLELICEELNIQYPEIPVFLNMLNIGSSPLVSLADLEIESYHLEQVQDTKFDMVCYLTEYQNGIEIMCHYFRHLFRPAAIEKMIKFYVKLLESIAGNPNKMVKDYQISDKTLKFKRY